MIHLRAGTYYLRRRVPARYATVEMRKTVWVSLHTDSASVAKHKANAAWSHLIEAWEARLAGDTSDAELRLEAAIELARVRGSRYLPAPKVGRQPISELLERVEAIPEHRGRPDRHETAALLGGVPEPSISVTRALELYWTLAAERTLGKSEDQLRRWRNPRLKAVRNFVAVVGDKAMADITADDMLDFRAWWFDRIAERGLTPNSANKDLIHLGDVLKTVNRMKRLGLSLPLGELSFKEAAVTARPPFSETWIRDKMLAAGSLEGLNDEARAIVLVMINTGARPSELANLTAKTIRLDTDVPHIAIEPDGRQVKSAYARRVVPLCGVSLVALRGSAAGFPRYRNKPGLSATVNKYLRSRGLCETPAHSLYSLRHSFEDRLLAAGVDERIRRDLMGHRLDRERYGKGASLNQLQVLLQPLAL